MKLVDKICQTARAGRPNEDSWGHNDRLFWVVDGATCLGAGCVAPPDSTDAVWLSEHITAFLKDTRYSPADVVTKGNNDNNDNEGDHVNWSHIYKEISDHIRHCFDREGGKLPATPGQEPLAAIKTLYDLGGGRMACAGLADCVVLAETDQGVKGIYGDPFHAALDEKSCAAITPYLQQGLGFTAAREKVLPIIQQGRNFVNTEDGFWDFSISNTFLDHIKTDVFTVRADGAVLIMSDGFYRLVDVFGHYTNETLLAKAKEDGLAPLYQQLRQTENQDDMGKTYPRLKQSDDATAVLIRNKH